MKVQAKFLLLLLATFCFGILIKNVLFFKERQKTTTSNMLIISATYYNHSTIYPQNSITILFNALQNFSHNLYCISKNAKGEKIISPLKIAKSFFSMEKCGMRGYAPNCLTVPNPNYFGFSFQSSFGSEIIIPTRNAIYQKLPIVSCVSPLFFNEQWHMNILSIEYYSYFGVSKQAYYYMSILESGYKLLKEYQNLGIIDLHPWTLPNVSEFRTELDFRNQHTAHNDCFLLYREAADFIIAHDPDDLLIIKNMTNLWNSFSSFVSMNPFIGNVMLERLNSYVAFGKSLKNNLNANTLSNIKVSDRVVWRKSFYLTEGVENINNHDASNLHTKYSSKFYNIAEGYFIHARNFTFHNFNSSNEIFDHPSFTEHRKILDFLNSTQLESFENAYTKRIQQFLKTETLKNLTLTSYYHRLIDECYEKVYYHNEKNPSKRCPSHYYCKIPIWPGVHCIHSKHEVITVKSKSLKVHIIKKVDDVKSMNGCYLN